MRREFQVHLLNEKGIQAATELGEMFSVLLNQIDQLIPGNSREKSLAITKLQEADFFAKRAVATLPENQE